MIDWAAFRAALGAADVVLAGEQHDLAAHHLAQLDVLREFHALKPGLASVWRWSTGPSKLLWTTMSQER